MGVVSSAGALTHEATTSSQLTALIGTATVPGTAAEGDRIHIQGPGPFKAPPKGWVIRKSLEIFGDGAGQDARDGSTSTILTPATRSDPVLVIDLGSTSAHQVLENVHIHDLQVHQVPQATAHNDSSNGIYFHSKGGKYLKDLRLERLWIRGMGNDGIHLVAPDGKFASTGITVINCTLENNLGQGLEVMGATEFYVLGGTFRMNGREGAVIKACLPAQVIGTGFENNLTDQAGGGRAELFLESVHAFLVEGCHFEENPPGKISRGIYVSGCNGGRISDNSFGCSGAKPVGTGIEIAWPVTNNVLIGTNWFSNVDVAVRIADNAQITSCTVMPQSVNHHAPGNAKIIVPETTDRGHLVIAPTLNKSNLTAGIAFPRLSTAKRDSMVATADGGSRREGLVTYSAGKRRLQHWDGSRWLEGVTSVSGSEQTFLNRSAAIPETTIVSSPPSGFYRVTVWFLKKAAGDGSRAVNLFWTDESGSQKKAWSIGGTPSSPAGTVVTEVLPLSIASGSLSLSCTASGGPTWPYALRIRVEALP